MDPGTGPKELRENVTVEACVVGGALHLTFVGVLDYLSGGPGPVLRVCEAEV